MPNRISYNKPYKSAKDLVQLLLTRGLIINDFNRAENYISHIGYYRLSAYMGLLVKKVHKIVGVLTYWSKLVHKYQFFPTFITSI